MNDLYYIEEDALKLLEDMLGDVVGSNQKTEAEILDIINEEAQAFYSGRKTAEEVVDIVVNRVHLYSCE